jgi:hypothetical protein
LGNASLFELAYPLKLPLRNVELLASGRGPGKAYLLAGEGFCDDRGAQGADRIRALGLALYMDRHSAHIAHFSKDDRDKALKWLEHNNPFILSLKEKRNKAL